jgi:4-carboxymuconolactone decarboxylase
MKQGDDGGGARIRPVTREQATTEQLAIGDRIFGSRNEDYGGPSAILLNVPALADRFDHLRDALVREQELPNAHLQLAALITARHWSAEYAWMKRVELCRAAGIPAPVIEAVRARRTPAFDDPGLALAHRYVMQLLEEHRVADDAHRELKALLGDRAIIELVMVVGFYSMLSLVCDAFEPKLPSDGGGI